MAPTADVRSTKRRYRDGTLVLETDMETDDGVVRLIDLMPPRQTTPHLVRVIQGLRGEVQHRFVELLTGFPFSRTGFSLCGRDIPTSVSPSRPPTGRVPRRFAVYGGIGTQTLKITRSSPSS